MAYGITVRLHGVQECLQKLQGIKRSVQRRILRKAVKAACTVVAKRGRSQVPRGPSGLLRKSLGFKLLKAKPGIFKAAGMVGPRARKFRRMVQGRGIVDPVKYAHLVEEGTKPHRITATTKPLAFKAFGQKRTLLPNLQTQRGRRAQKVIAQSVQHPGSRPQRFLQRIQVTGQSGMATAFRGTVQTELHREAAKAKPSEVDDG